MEWKRWLARWAKRKMAEEKQEALERIRRLFDEAMSGDEEAMELVAMTIATSHDNSIERRTIRLLWALVHGVRKLPTEEELNRRLEERIKWRKTE